MSPMITLLRKPTPYKRTRAIGRALLQGGKAVTLMAALYFLLIAFLSFVG